MFGYQSHHERPGARIVTMWDVRRIPFPNLSRVVGIVARCGKRRAEPLVTGRHKEFRRNNRSSRSQ